MRLTATRKSVCRPMSSIWSSQAGCLPNAAANTPSEGPFCCLALKRWTILLKIEAKAYPAPTASATATDLVWAHQPGTCIHCH